jgi:membrane glycosyltransferase
MSLFGKYLRAGGAGRTELQMLSERIGSWHELHRWIGSQKALSDAPPMRRRPVVPPDIDLSWLQSIACRLMNGRTREQGPKPGWLEVVAYRQRVSLALTVVSTFAVLYLSNLVLREQQMPELGRLLYLGIYAVMVFFLASNLFKMMLGTWHALRGPAGNPWHPLHKARAPQPGVRVAIAFPVFHEDVSRLAAGMAATWQSLAASYPHLADRFDMFLLSDSRLPEYRIAEKCALHRLRESFPIGRFYYRRRPLNQNAKMGNITDFCRRWGDDYKYILIMDADSVMEGQAIVTLLRMMEGNDAIGILQTNPTPILRTSLFGRMQQFSARLYGSVFSYSLQSMYMGHASYIGHNAMIRLEPFIRHCMLPKLSGPAPWGGKPLSHDIVESAMMARAGYEVWFLPEIAGSYEEVPANLLAHLVRERRWMQGNLQHLRLLSIRGLRNIHRETFISGSMGYLAAPLWAAFLLVSGYGMFHFLDTGVLAMSGIRMLALPMLMLFFSSMIFLFMPRLLSLAIHIRSDKARGYGGKDKLILSMLLETLFSLLFSPIQMIAVSRFLWLWVRRKSISWGTQVRGDEPLPWRTCVRHFGWISLLGVVGLSLILLRMSEVSPVGSALLRTMSGGRLGPDDLVIWLLPILAGFCGSAWIARASSFTYPSVLKRHLFIIPEEIEPPAIVKNLAGWQAHFVRLLPNVHEPQKVFAYAVSDPRFYAWHRAGLHSRPTLEKALLPTIEAGRPLTFEEMGMALFDARCFHELHLRTLAQAVTTTIPSRS